jgi:DNA modification methylase
MNKPAVEMVATDKLIPYARNAKKHDEAQVALIAGSIRQFGFNNPILIAEDNGIVAGHGRVLAAMKLGLAEVPCIRLSHLDENQRRAYILADNRLAELGGGWDLDMLAAEMDALGEVEIDVGELGFDEAFLSLMDLTETESEVDAEAQIDKAEELRVKWGVETGQLWQLGDHRLLCGDSTKAEDVERCLGGVVPLLMVTDPPYGVEYDANWRIGAGAVGKVMNDDRCDWREAWALFPGDVAYIWHASLHSHEVAASILAVGFSMRAMIIWAKNQLCISRGHYHWKHEPCWYAVKNGRTANWIGDRKQNTLWEIEKPQASETGHSTQKPVECMARPIRNHNSEYVYEPFSGSGTTLIACEQLGRKCRAIEIHPPYVAVALQRWADATGKTPVLI